MALRSDCIFEIGTKKGVSEEKADADDRFLRLLSAVKIDNLYENQTNLDSEHMFLQRQFLEPKDVIERLMRINQDYKAYTQHALNL